MINFYKKEISETNALLLEWNLDESNIFQALCISFNVLLEIFLSDRSYFAYGEFSFNRELVIITEMELKEIFKANDSVSESNPSLENKFNLIDDKFSKMESNIFKMESNLEKMMS